MGSRRQSPPGTLLSQALQTTYPSASDRLGGGGDCDSAGWAAELLNHRAGHSTGRDRPDRQRCDRRNDRRLLRRRRWGESTSPHLVALGGGAVLPRVPDLDPDRLAMDAKPAISQWSPSGVAGGCDLFGPAACRHPLRGHPIILDGFDLAGFLQSAPALLGVWSGCPGCHRAFARLGALAPDPRAPWLGRTDDDRRFVLADPRGCAISKRLDPVTGRRDERVDHRWAER